MQASEIAQRIENAEVEVRRLADVIIELQDIVDYPESHWSKVVKELRLANETLRQKRDQLISLLAATMASVAMTRATEIVDQGICDITTITVDALDLAGYDHCYGDNEGKYPTQLPWLHGKVFNVSETFRGERLIEWMINTASLNHHNAYHICQLLLDLGVYVQIGANIEQEMFQPHNFYQWNVLSNKCLLSESAAIPKRLSSDIWPPPQVLQESSSIDSHEPIDTGRGISNDVHSLPRRLSSDIWPPPQSLEGSTSSDCHGNTEYQMILAQVEEQHQIAMDNIETRHQAEIQRMKDHYESVVDMLEQQLYTKERTSSQRQDVVKYSVDAQCDTVLMVDTEVQVDLLPDLPPESDAPPTPGEFVPSPLPPPPPGPPVLSSSSIGECVSPPPPPPGASVPPLPPPTGEAASPLVPPPPGEAMPAVFTRKPKQPLRPLFWRKVNMHPAVIVGKSLVWSDVPVIELPEDMGLFEELFSKKRKSTGGAHSSIAQSLVTRTPKVVTVLDEKRLRSVAVVMRTIPYSMEDITHVLYNMETSVIDMETLQQLHTVQPSKPELDLITDHLNSVGELDKPDMFLYQLSHIEHFNERLSCLLFQSTFHEVHSEVNNKLTTMDTLLMSLSTGEGVMKLLGLILALGNYMNHGNHSRGNAGGFELELLGKLADVQSNDRKTSLLSVVARLYIEQFYSAAADSVGNLFPLPEPADFMVASHFNFDDIARDISTLEARLKDCENDVNKMIEASSSEHLKPMKEKMEEFISQAQKSLDEVIKKLSSTQELFNKVVEYYSVIPKVSEDHVTVSHFFSFWSKFSHDLKKEWQLQQKWVAKQWASTLRRDRSKVLKKPVVAGGLKQKLKLSRKS